jgi:Protein of unknown function (DUF3892)
MVRIYDAAFAIISGTKHWHLSDFWWIDDSGNRGHWTRAEAYGYVVNNPKIVYVSEGNTQVLVYARYDKNTDTKWVQTYADGIWKDNLTALAERHKRGLVNS